MSRLFKFISAIFLGFALVISTALSPASAGAYTQPKPLLFYGDSQSGQSAKSLENHKQIVAGITAQNPAIVFHVGDLVSYKYDLGDWLEFDSVTANLRSMARFLPAIGNHDAYTINFNQRFNLPRGGRYYSTTYGRLYFIILDSNAPFRSDTYQYQWFVANLKKAQSLHKTIIVIFHHPAVASDGGEYNSRRLLPLLQKYHVRMVFSGDYHNYERSYYQGTYFIITGGGGATLYPREKVGPFSQKYFLLHHFCRLDLLEKNLRLKVFDQNLNLLDSLAVSY